MERGVPKRETEINLRELPEQCRRALIDVYSGCSEIRGDKLVVNAEISSILDNIFGVKNQLDCMRGIPLEILAKAFRSGIREMHKCIMELCLPKNEFSAFVMNCIDPTTGKTIEMKEAFYIMWYYTYVVIGKTMQEMLVAARMNGGTMNRSCWDFAACRMGFKVPEKPRSQAPEHLERMQLVKEWRERKRKGGHS